MFEYPKERAEKDQGAATDSTASKKDKRALRGMSFEEGEKMLSPSSEDKGKASTGKGTKKNKKNKKNDLDVCKDKGLSHGQFEAVAKYWGVSYEDAVSHIASTIRQGTWSKIAWEVEKATTAADQTVLQAYVDSPFSYNDAETLSQHWQMDIEGAKQYIGHRVLDGATEELKAKLAEMEPPSKVREVVDRPVGETEDDLDLCKDKGLSHGQFEAVANYWGVSYEDAVSHIASTIRQGTWSKIAWEVEKATAATDQTVLQAYVDSSFSYNDAETLSDHWHMDIDGAKHYIGRRILDGATDELKTKLAEMSRIRVAVDRPAGEQALEQGSQEPSELRKFK